MKRFELNAMPRVEGGKKALKALRAEGCIPAVLVVADIFNFVFDAKKMYILKFLSISNKKVKFPLV